MFIKELSLTDWLILILILIGTFILGLFASKVEVSINYIDLTTAPSRSAILLAIIIFAGVFSGVVRNAYEKRPKLFEARAILLGLLASLLCPLFLKTISSDLLTKFFQEQNYFHEAFIVLSFFLLSSFFAQNFISTLKERVLQDLANVKNDVENNEDITIASSYTNLSNDSKLLLSGLLELGKVTLSIEDIEANTVLEGESLNDALEQLLSSKLVEKIVSKNCYKIRYKNKLRKLDVKYGPRT